MMCNPASAHTELETAPPPGTVGHPLSGRLSGRGAGLAVLVSCSAGASPLHSPTCSARACRLIRGASELGSVRIVAISGGETRCSGAEVLYAFVRGCRIVLKLKTSHPISLFILGNVVKSLLCLQGLQSGGRCFPSPSGRLAGCQSRYRRSSTGKIPCDIIGVRVHILMTKVGSEPLRGANTVCAGQRVLRELRKSG